MTESKTKRNARGSQENQGFKISEPPVVCLAHDAQPSDASHQIDLKQTPEKPFLFAIARDAHTIFASWDIDWRSVFAREMPADRQIHLRVIDHDGVIVTTTAVEPMSAVHYLTVSGFHASYHVEIGYFQPMDSWHCVATSHDVEMPSHRSVELGDVDLATIPFHICFQQLANLFGTSDDSPTAKVVSKFQKRVSGSDKPNEATPSDTQILRELNLSRTGIAAAQRDFKKSDVEKLARRAMRSICPTSPARRFEPETSWS